MSTHSPVEKEVGFTQEELSRFKISKHTLCDLLLQTSGILLPADEAILHYEKTTSDETTISYKAIVKEGKRHVFDEEKLCDRIEPVHLTKSELSFAGMSIKFRASDKDSLYMALNALDHYIPSDIKCVVVAPEDARAASEMHKARIIHSDEKTGKREGLLHLFEINERVYLFDPPSIFDDDQLISYQQRDGMHVLSNHAGTRSQPGDLRTIITAYAGSLNGGHTNYFIAPQDQASRTALQLAFEGKSDFRLDGKVLRILH